MTRISENQIQRRALQNIVDNRTNVNKYSDEVSTGVKVSNPGDTRLAGTISQFRDTLGKVDGYRARIASTTSALTFQDDVLSQTNDLLIRAREIAAQAANETNGTTTRAQMSEEVFQLRDQLVNFANSTYQGRYIYGTADDDDPPYDQGDYSGSPASGPASVRYFFDGEAGTHTTRTVAVSDDVDIKLNTAGDFIFERGIRALEALGRSLAGYRTDTSPVDYTAYTPAGTTPTAAQFAEQTADIQNAIQAIDLSRQNDILPERVNLGGRLKRLETAGSLLELTKASAQTVIDQLQNADIVEAASNLSVAQTALQASLAVSVQVLNQTILDYI